MVYTLKYTYSYSNGVIQMSDSGIFENANSFTLIQQHPIRGGVVQSCVTQQGIDKGKYLYMPIYKYYHLSLKK